MNLISLDENLFIFINGFVGKAPWFDNLVKLVVNEYFVPVTLSLIVLYLWFALGKNKEKNQKAVSIAFFSVIILGVLIAISNQFIIRDRPFNQLPTNLLFYRPTDPSFPSNAAAVGFALATAVFLANRRMGVSALILAAFYSFSRVYAGVHFPSDVMAGATIGVFCALLVAKFTRLVESSTELIKSVQKRLKLELD